MQFVIYDLNTGQGYAILNYFEAYMHMWCKYGHPISNLKRIMG